MHEFIYNDMNSRDYGLTISGEDTWVRPQPELNRISVPGRNGDLIQLENRFKNLDITYHCGIIEHLRENFEAFNERLLSDLGYHRLEDSYHPDYYRMGVFESALEPDVKKRGLVASVDITFNCKPQLFLKSGSIEQEILNGGYIYNPTPYKAKPLLRFSFSGQIEGGTITINDVSISSTDPTLDTFVIDCDKQDIYRESDRRSWNNGFTLLDGDFFELKPGRNLIQCTGLQLDTVYITPNWWTL